MHPKQKTGNCGNRPGGYLQPASRKNGVDPHLSFGELLQSRKERWVGDSGRLGATDQSLTLGAQSRYGERHGDAMIVKGIEFGAAQTLASGYLESVITLFDLGTHQPQIPSHGRDAVRFL